MASIAQDHSPQLFEIHGSWPDSLVSQENGVDLPSLFLSHPPLLPPLERSAPQTLSAPRFETDRMRESSIQELLLSVSHMQVRSDAQGHVRTASQNKFDESTTAGSTGAQPRLPISQRPRPSSRLASSRGFILTQKESLSQLAPKHTPRSPVPGEFLEAHSLTHSMNIKVSEAVHHTRPVEGNMSEQLQCTEETAKPLAKHFRRWTHFAGFSKRLRRKDARENAEHDPSLGSDLQMDKGVKSSTPSSWNTSPRLKSSRHSAPVASPFLPYKLDKSSATKFSRVDLPLSSPAISTLSSPESVELERRSPRGKAVKPAQECSKSDIDFPNLEVANCTVCGDVISVSQLPERPITKNCSHSSSTCLKCVQKWIETTIEDQGWDQCKCPECASVLSHDDIKRLATPETFIRYDHLATRAALSSMPNFLWCQRPGCSSGQIHNGSKENNPVFTCVSCGYTYCLNHPNPPFHFGETCTQFDLREAGSKRTALQILQEKRSERLVQDTSKRCPNAMCGWWIEKMEGCDHMTCSKCKFEFCWLCCAAFEPIRKKGNKYHKRECKYYG